MTVISRVMWQADIENVNASDILDDSVLAISPWALDHNGEILAEGTTNFERAQGNNPGKRSVQMRRKVDSIVVNLADYAPNGDQWGVDIYARVDGALLHVLIDNTFQSLDPSKPVTVGRPAVIDGLLKIGNEQKFGESRLLMESVEVSGEEAIVIAEQIENEGRGLPMVVVTRPRTCFSERRSFQLRNMVKRLTGLATVIILDPDAQDVLKEKLPEGLSVWGGAIRVYAPARLDSPYRHRLFTAALLDSRGLDPVVNWTTSLSARRLPPAPLRELLRHVASFGSGTDDKGREEGEVEHFDFQRYEQELDDLRLELAESQSRVNDLEGEVSRLRKAGFEQGKTDIVVSAEYPPENGAPDDVDSIEDAIHQAQIHLTSLSIPEGALREIDKLDASPNSISWGKTLWRGLKALNAYCLEAQGGKSAGFYDWCTKNGSWPATSKKLAMKESESVHNNPKFRSARVLPCDKHLSSDETHFMEAHLKISEGGGDIAPRVYFYDDSSGDTRKVHVGFIGPHHLMPNTRS